MNSMHQLSSLSESGSFERSGGSSVLAAAIALALGVPSTVRAADAPDQKYSAPAGLEEIVVTAGRREQTVQDIPYNISAVTGAQLDNASINDLSGIARLVPGLQTADLGFQFALQVRNKVIGAYEEIMRMQV